jgi:hypothetical protein
MPLDTLPMTQFGVERNVAVGQATKPCTPPRKNGGENLGFPYLKYHNVRGDPLAVPRQPDDPVRHRDERACSPAQHSQRAHPQSEPRGGHGEPVGLGWSVGQRGPERRQGTPAGPPTNTPPSPVAWLPRRWPWARVRGTLGGALVLADPLLERLRYVV